MPYITYTALDRELKAGHTASTSYSISIPFQEVRELRVDRSGRVYTYDDTVYGTYYPARKGYYLTTDIRDLADMDDFNEFLASVEGGEEFTLDITGEIGSPDNPQTVTLISYNEPEVVGPLRMQVIRLTVKLA